MRPHTMFDSEPESSKLKQVADQFFDIANQYMGLMIPLMAGLTPDDFEVTLSLDPRRMPATIPT
jgi:hypothetical protein